MMLCPGYLKERGKERKKIKTAVEKKQRAKTNEIKRQENKKTRRYITITTSVSAKIGRTGELQHDVAEAGVDSSRYESRW